MIARIITVKPRLQQAKLISDILLEKGYFPEIMEGFNYSGEFNQNFKEHLMHHENQGFFRGHKIFNDFISLCCALSHKKAIELGDYNDDGLLILEDDVVAAEIPDVEKLSTVWETMLQYNFDIVLLSEYWERKDPAAFLQETRKGNGAGCYLVNPSSIGKIFSQIIMGHIDQHFIQMHLKKRIKTYVSNYKVKHALSETTRNESIWIAA